MKYKARFRTLVYGIQRNDKKKKMYVYKHIQAYIKDYMQQATSKAPFSVKDIV